MVEAAGSIPWPRLQRVLTHEGAEELLALATATWGANHAGVQACRERLSLPAAQLNPEPLLTGDDLVAQGLRPGRYFGELLEFVRDAQLEQQICNREQALELANQWVARHATD